MPCPLFSALFPDVVNCMQTDNLELKKLVYLYLMNYAKSQPDMAIMAVNTFVKVKLHLPSLYLKNKQTNKKTHYIRNSELIFQVLKSAELELPCDVISRK